MRGRAAYLVLVVVVLALWTASASAEIVKIGLAGDLVYVDPYSETINGLFSVGDPFSGAYVYIYDPDMVGDGNPLPGVGDYLYLTAPSGISLNVSGWTIQSDPEEPYFLIEILNDHTGVDGYLLDSAWNLPLSNGVPIMSIRWQLDDLSATALSSTDLPTTPPVLEDWEQSFGLTVEFIGRSGPLVRGMVRSVWLVPEPSTAFVLALGSIALLKGRRARSRN
jgi:hypothetical protein